jgi:hypothetical protein
MIQISEADYEALKRDAAFVRDLRGQVSANGFDLPPLELRYENVVGRLGPRDFRIDAVVSLRCRKVGFWGGRMTVQVKPDGLTDRIRRQMHCDDERSIDVAESGGVGSCTIRAA